MGICSVSDYLRAAVVVAVVTVVVVVKPQAAFALHLLHVVNFKYYN